MRASLEAPGASPEEAAAIIAAIERFRDDTARASPARGRDGHDGWLRAARLEGAGGAADEPTPWGDGHPWGRSS